MINENVGTKTKSIDRFSKIEKTPKLSASNKLWAISPTNDEENFKRILKHLKFSWKIHQNKRNNRVKAIFKVSWRAELREHCLEKGDGRK